MHWGRFGILLILGVARITTASEITLDFTLDPHWEGVNNLPKSGQSKTTTQDFGYSRTHFTGGKSEIGGQITRSLTPAKYMKPIAPKSLNDHLIASGTLVIPFCSGGSG